MAIDVLAEELQPDHVIELPTEHGTRIIRLTVVERRTNGIKIMGRTEAGALYSSGMKYGQLVRCVRP